MRRAVRRLPSSYSNGRQRNPVGIVSGPDGQVWFVEQSGNNVGHIPVTATSGADISEIALPTAGSFPSGITAGSDNALYFAEQNGNRVGRIPTNATSTSAITEITLPVAGSAPSKYGNSRGWHDWFTEQAPAVNSVG